MLGQSKQANRKQCMLAVGYRTDTSRNRNTGGTGLGLYIVRKIMEMHHAEYGIQNTKRGVLFWIKLPIKQSPFNSI